MAERKKTLLAKVEEVGERVLSMQGKGTEGLVTLNFKQ